MINKNYQKWLKIEDAELQSKLLNMSEEEINNCFGKQLEFGTAGLRGIMDLGTSRLNVINICKLANAVLSFCKKHKYQSVVVGFDTRHNSKAFSRVFAKVLSCGGIKVNIFNSFVPTPVLAYAIDYTKSNLGIMITASHNNKIYNGVKISKSPGIQISGENEKEMGALYEKLDEVKLYNSYLKIKKYNKNNVNFLKKDVIRAFLGDFYKNKINSSLNIIYTPLNGTACEYVLKALKGSGFNHIVVPHSQKSPNGDFKTCPYPNPEFLETYKEALKKTDFFDADVIVATDPDGDRLGAMIKSTKGYKLLTGNEVGFLLLKYLHENKPKEKNEYAISTVVSSPMFFDMCDAYGIKYEKTLTGFKNMGLAKQKMENKYGKDGFVISYEESCGYVVKDNFYDKDGIFALLKFCEMASFLKNAGSSVEEYLNSIYEKFDNMYSLGASLVFSGENAKESMNQKVNELREKGIKSLLKKKIISTVDYLTDDTGLEPSNFIEYKTKDFSFIIRPSGTEPKLKFYIHAKGKTLDESKKLASEILNAIKKDIFEVHDEA